MTSTPGEKPDAGAPAAAPAAAPTRDPGAPSAYRPFLDGLRAVAVLGVLVYHLNRNWLPGGFLGVDIFFVLSGYLITMLLLNEHRKTGRIHLPTFWARRIRRLLPALLVVLVVMVVSIDLGGDPLAQGQARGDLLSTLFYFANWHFISEGQSYFTQFLAVSPDRHTWSLAIEEQFYLFWPIVAAFVLTRFRERTLGVVAATVGLASALWMVVIFSPGDPSRAYYGTDSRIFEILIGALLAVALAGSLRDRIASLGRRLAPLALLVIAAAFVWLGDDNSFYYRGGAVILSLAAATLIAGLEAGSPIDRLLSVRPMVMVGLVSYGMYLWHFPIITFINQWVGPTSTPWIALLAVGLTFAVTAVSFVVVESPIRRRGLLLGYKLTPARLASVVPARLGRRGRDHRRGHGQRRGQSQLGRRGQPSQRDRDLYACAGARPVPRLLPPILPRPRRADPRLCQLQPLTRPPGRSAVPAGRWASSATRSWPRRCPDCRPRARTADGRSCRRQCPRARSVTSRCTTTAERRLPPSARATW